MCKICKEKGETVNKIVNECSKLAQTEYKKRHKMWLIEYFGPYVRCMVSLTQESGMITMQKR